MKTNLMAGGTKDGHWTLSGYCVKGDMNKTNIYNAQ